MSRSERSDRATRRQRPARAPWRGSRIPWALARLPWRVARAAVGVNRRAVGFAVGSVTARPDVSLWLLALVLLAIDIPTIPQSFHSSYLLATLAGLIDVAPVVVVRRHPLTAWAATAVTAAMWYAVSDPVVSHGISWSVVQFLVQMIALLAVALLARPVEVVIVTALSAVLTIGLLPTELRAWFVAQAAVVVVGVLVRWLVRSRTALAAKSVESDAERARREVLEERSRIARELHDIVAHSMSMIVVQAQSAPVRLPGMAAEVEAEFRAIEASARQALTEVRGTLGVLRDDGARQSLAPQPGATDLPVLLAASRSAGLDVDWRIDLDPQICPAGTGLMLHRVLQEALANAGRHAPGAHVEVVLAGDRERAELVVRNGPPVRATGVETAETDGGTTDRTGGHGIPGMRARVEAVGGTLRIGPLTDGGFALVAAVPLAGRPLAGRPLGRHADRGVA